MLYTFGELLLENFKTVRRKYVEAGADEKSVNGYLERFRNLSAQNKLKGTERDIDRVTKNLDFDEFRKWVEEKERAKTITQIKRKKLPGQRINLATIEKEGFVYYFDVPLDKEASCNIGKNTDWCISKPDKMHWEDYVTSGNVFIMISIKIAEDKVNPVAALAFPNSISKDGKLVKDNPTPNIFAPNDSSISFDDLIEQYLENRFSEQELLNIIKRIYTDQKIRKTIEQFYEEHDKNYKYVLIDEIKKSVDYLKNKPAAFGNTSDDKWLQFRYAIDDYVSKYFRTNDNSIAEFVYAVLEPIRNGSIDFKTFTYYKRVLSNNSLYVPEIWSTGYTKMNRNETLDKNTEFFMSKLVDVVMKYQQQDFIYDMMSTIKHIEDIHLTDEGKRAKSLLLSDDISGKLAENILNQIMMKGQHSKRTNFLSMVDDYLQTFKKKDMRGWTELESKVFPWFVKTVSSYPENTTAYYRHMHEVVNMLIWYAVDFKKERLPNNVEQAMWDLLVDMKENSADSAELKNTQWRLYDYVDKTDVKFPGKIWDNAKDDETGEIEF